MSSERVERIRKISDEAIAHDQALVTALRERAEIAETDKGIAVEDNIRLMNENERLEADLTSARQAIDVLNERQRMEWARAKTAEARVEGLEGALREIGDSSPDTHTTSRLREIARDALGPAKETT